MHIIMIDGHVVSDEIKVLKTTNGIPLCRFTLSSSSDHLNCLITGKQAYAFLYEVEKGTKLSLTGRFNNRNQFIILSYSILKKPSYLGQIFNYKGHPLPLAKNK
ncbi:ssDNA-binding protein [Marinilactibacillus kalidii]|uniref:ssDNA-binding protein n=1 Tax=Marinilactibacillus kalidii TaxID=2820274 RepID=UPI001ABDF851|nr:ssDNA-binding protein [Marinilactibacillus kalidii]